MKELLSIGIQPDILLCRTDRHIPKEERRKLSLFCNVRESAVIKARRIEDGFPEWKAAGLPVERVQA